MKRNGVYVERDNAISSFSVCAVYPKVRLKTVPWRTLIRSICRHASTISGRTTSKKCESDDCAGRYHSQLMYRIRIIVSGIKRISGKGADLSWYQKVDTLLSLDSDRSVPWLYRPYTRFPIHVCCWFGKKAVHSCLCIGYRSSLVGGWTSVSY